MNVKYVVLSEGLNGVVHNRLSYLEYVGFQDRDHYVRVC